MPSLRYSATNAFTRRVPRPVQLARYTTTPAEPQNVRINKTVPFRLLLTHFPLQIVRLSKWRRALQAIGRLTIGTVILAGAGFYYVAYQERTPGLQLPHDPTKKTLVVLGSGWGATSFLKKLDTTDYNVVSSLVSFSQSNWLHLKSGSYQPSQLFPLHALAPQCVHRHPFSKVDYLM